MEGAIFKPITVGRYVAFYGILLYYVAFSSVFTIHFVCPFTLRLLKIVWLIFNDKRWNVLACLLCLAAVVRHVFKNNKDYVSKGPELVDNLPLDIEHSSYPSPPSPLPYFTSLPSSPSPTLFSCSSPQPSSCSLHSLSPPPPPPFRMRSWKFNYYVRMASNVSLSSDDSESEADYGDRDIDIKADKFIEEFRRRLHFENQQYMDDES